MRERERASESESERKKEPRRRQKEEVSFFVEKRYSGGGVPNRDRCMLRGRSSRDFLKRLLIMGGTQASKTTAAASSTPQNPTVVFVLGGPGAGKGTQCANIVRDYKFTHLSAGDLLRAHMKSGTADGNMVAQMIKDGKIVPSSVTVNLLLAAMEKSGSNRFLIDGFPRNKENRDAWVKVAGYDCDFVLMYDCTEDVMLERLLGRNEGRTDDNVESIKKRFVTFRESSMPVVEFYEKLGKVRKVNAVDTPDKVYEKTRESFERFA